MNVIHKFSTSDEQGKQLYRYFDGNEWVEKWEKNDVATRMLMEDHLEKIEPIRNKVLAEELSPLGYHIEAKLFSISLLSSYTGISKRHIRKHLKPEYFNQLDGETLNNYANAFGISIDELKKL